MRSNEHSAKQSTTLRNLFTVVATVAGTMFVLSCSGGDATGPDRTPPPAPTSPSVARVVVDPPQIEMVLGETSQLTATPEDARGVPVSGKMVTWSSSNPNVASVSSSGLVTGLANGTVSIRATIASVSGNASVSVVDLIIAEEVVVVDSTQLQLLSDSSEIVAGVLRFDIQGNNPPSVSVGDVLVGAQNGGFLRRVTAVSTSGNTVTAQTEPAALADIVRGGSFQGTIQLDLAPSAGGLIAPSGRMDVRLGGSNEESQSHDITWGTPRVSYAAQGVTVANQALTLTGTDLCKNLLVGGCPGGAKVIIGSGTIDFDPSFDVGADWGFFSLKDFHALASGTLTLDLGASFTSPSPVSMSGETLVFRALVPFTFPLGPIPVAGVVTFSIFAGFDAQASLDADIRTSVSAVQTVTVGARYDNSAWSGVLSSPPPQFSWQPPQWSPTASAKLRVHVSPKLELSFYNTLSGAVDLDPFLEATGTVVVPNWRLLVDAGLDADMQMAVSVLSLTVATFQKNLLGIRTNLVDLTGTIGGNQAPTAAITAPTNGASFVQGESITFTGTGSDPEDGTLPGSGLAWSSSLNGALGTGTSLATSSLSVGAHTITLTPTDSKGLSGQSAQIQVMINQPGNQAPTATITTPANGSTFTQGQSITFTGTGSDPEDGTLSGSGLAWSSSLNGALGTGTSLTTSALSVGTHAITLTPTDSKGLSGQPSQIQVTIKKAGNQGPLADLAFYTDRDGNWEVYGINADGTGLVNLTNHAASDRHPAWSPDGTRIAFVSDRSGSFDIWIMGADGTNPVQVTTNADADEPDWSPDGAQIVFTRRTGAARIWVMNADGSNQRQLTSQFQSETSPDWSADGSRISFTGNSSAFGPDIYDVLPDGSQLRQLTNTGAEGNNRSYSKDDRFIYFSSGRTGAASIGGFEIWRMDTDGANQIQLTTNSVNDADPAISADGTRLAFVVSAPNGAQFTNWQLWLMNADGTSQHQLLTEPAGTFLHPVWHP